MKLNYNKQDVSHVIEKKLKAIPRSGAERNVWYVIDGKKVLRVTFPHGNGVLPKGTALSIINQLKVSKAQFKDLVDCPMSSSDYEVHIRSLKLI